MTAIRATRGRACSVRRRATPRRQAWFAMRDAAVTSGVGSPRTLRLRRLTSHSQCICGKLFLEAIHDVHS